MRFPPLDMPVKAWIDCVLLTWDLSRDTPEHANPFEHGKEKSYRELICWTFVIDGVREKTLEKWSLFSGMQMSYLNIYWTFVCLFGFNVSVCILCMHCIFIEAYVLECLKKRNISKWEVAFVLYSWYDIMCLVSWPNIIIWRTRPSIWVPEHGLQSFALVLIILTPTISFAQKTGVGALGWTE